MTRTFADDSHFHTRALQIWQILIGRAHNRQEITYRDLRHLMGYPEGSYNVLSRCLDPVMRYCQQNNLPPLTVLVVGERTGKPGQGFTAGSGDWNSDRARVFAFDWYSIFPPTPDELQGVPEEAE